ncbi:MULTISPECIES: alanine racemase [unclassified Undibacterium]|uniref:alanine racemase n=1 Tax=unclassified Undibacterium TaxID=2630295 RepID=UPI002AC919E3|nr:MULTISPECIES: alanine racemase [unclassified Undibacterium]MEB0138219.1 alanine racemase [Undibacterium sp. CCC2.1]MEB0171620.1 alanine racemase [Undibacterium sp. CCC1.1]MEB0175460.1 alanine racemase [Undibacterium sp. CCC3.4]MEB0214820.1 alanine racemase [Undibacterium sp. 5I2]WPX45307.1 alanine racemase [Undibacterium sp. CCC3.4]
MQQMSGRAGAVLQIDLQAIRDNYALLCAQLGPARCGAAVKADAYGLGAVPIAKALYQQGCRHFFVAHLEEAIALRAHLPAAAALIVMHGAPVGYEAEFLEYQCTPVLNSLEQMQAWQTLALVQQRALAAIVQVDTGMARMGLSATEVTRCSSDAALWSGITVTHLMSHLACAEDQSHPMNHEQLARFTALRKIFPHSLATLANSSGIFLGSDFHFDLARPGAALYGVAPIAGAPNPMRAVVSLQGRIIQTRDISAGTGVGYGLSWQATESTRIATVAVGYADGWLRSLSNRGLAYINDVAVNIVGKVSMDTITLDVTHIAPEYLVAGALVDLISPTHTVDHVAATAQTIAYEILTSLGQRYARHYTN